MKLVEIARFADPYEATIAASALRAAGFEVEAFDQQAGQMLNHMQPAFYGFRLMMPDGQAQDAAAFLAAIHKEAPTSRLEPSGGYIRAGLAGGLGILFGPLIGWLFVRRRRRGLED